MNEVYYRLTNVTYCFPYNTTRYIVNRFSKDCLSEENHKLLGVLAPYIQKKMTEQEVDEFLCKIIKNHPYMKDAIYVEITVDRYTKNYIENYQTLMIRNSDYEKERRSMYVASPIEWRYDYNG